MSEPPAEQDLLRRRVTVDITCDLMDEDEPVACGPSCATPEIPRWIEAGAIVLAGDPDAPAVAEVVDIDAKPAGAIVHLRLPGAIEDYEALVARAITSKVSPGRHQIV